MQNPLSLNETFQGTNRKSQIIFEHTTGFPRKYAFDMGLLSRRDEPSSVRIINKNWMYFDNKFTF